MQSVDSRDAEAEVEVGKSGSKGMKAESEVQFWSWVEAEVWGTFCCLMEAVVVAEAQAVIFFFSTSHLAVEAEAVQSHQFFILGWQSS